MKKLLIFILLVHISLNYAQAENGEIVSSNDTCINIDLYLSKLAAEKNFSGGLLIVKDGRKIFSKGYGWANKEMKIPFSSNTLASMGSITKAFTASAIMKLVEERKVSVNDNLKKYFPDVPVDKSGITIHQLLTHSSGFSEFLENDGGDYERVETTEYLKRAFEQPLAFNPGEKAIYTNVGMSILAIIVEKVSGMDYEEYLKKALFDPIGVRRISYCYPELQTDTIAHGYNNGTDWGTHQSHFKNAGGGPYWNLKGNGGLEASLNDMYTWVNAISEAKVLSESTLQTMFKRHIVEEGMDGNYYFGYGCNISKSRRNTEMIDNGGSNGIYYARLIRLPEEGVVFYMVTNEKSANTNKVLPNVTQLYFQGKIVQDAFEMQSGFESPISEKIFSIIKANDKVDLEDTLLKAKITVNDDMELYEVGRRFVDNGNADAAFCLFKYFTEKYPELVVGWNELGEVYELKNNNPEAIKCYRTALALRPENPRALNNLKRIGLKN